MFQAIFLNYVWENFIYEKYKMKIGNLFFQQYYTLQTCWHKSHFACLLWVSTCHDS